MHPVDCPQFDYEVQANRNSIPRNLQEIYNGLSSGSMNVLNEVKDTRSVHKKLFSFVTPPGCDYFAGHYRGEDFRCLRFCDVMVPDDTRVGLDSQHVVSCMQIFADYVEEAVKALETQYGGLDTSSSGSKLGEVVRLACFLFVEFLTIHPYLNGNGHAGRFMLVGILQKYGYQARRFPIDPRPDNPYIQGIIMHRNGDPDLLEEFVLSCVAV